MVTSMPSLVARVLLLLGVFAIIGRVDAHGYVHTVVANNQDYTGWLPFSDPYADPVPVRIIRHIPDDGPITDISSSDLACNTGGDKGTTMIADINAGSNILFLWDYWPSDHLGPVSSYMTSCNGDCSSFDPTGAKWFKIDAAGYDQSTATWASAALISNNASWTSPIPSNLAPGQYLVRHEIVALHVTGQPQFYPSCTQVNVKGSGNGTPSSSQVVTIPGLYNGVQWPDIWGTFGAFTIPGPPVIFTSDEDGSSSFSAAPLGSGAATAPASAQTAPGSGSSPTAGSGSGTKPNTGKSGAIAAPGGAKCRLQKPLSAAAENKKRTAPGSPPRSARHVLARFANSWKPHVWLG